MLGYKEASFTGLPLILGNKIPGAFQDHFGIFQVSSSKNGEQMNGF
jgi:hypothetical protein